MMGIGKIILIIILSAIFAVIVASLLLSLGFSNAMAGELTILSFLGFAVAGSTASTGRLALTLAIVVIFIICGLYLISTLPT